MKSKDALAGLSALAHEGRIQLFRMLVWAGHDGMPAGQLAEAAGAQFTTTSAQLNVLANAGLVESKRAGRSIIYTANYKAIRELFGFLLTDCCQGHPEIVKDLISLEPQPECCDDAKGETR